MMPLEKITGTVINIQHYSIHDGPGIRTTVFLKGCPLKCLWCQNPESQSIKPEIFLNLEKCTGCGLCVPACPEKAIRIHDGRSRTDRNRCTGCGACTQVCPSEARTLASYRITAGEVYEDVNKDAIFYANSSGGVTLSGGEPLFQPDFSAAILQLCHESGMHTAIETSGFGNWERFKGLLAHTDLVLYDLKHMNTEAHEVCTGVPNGLILENARRIYHELKLPITIRVPVIPGYNDSIENFEKLGSFVANDLGADVSVYLLPYHRLGIGKNEQLEREQPLGNVVPPDETHMKNLRNILIRFNLNIDA